MDTQEKEFIMCEYCERGAGVKFGWKQPALPYHGQPPMKNLGGNALDTDKWDGYIRDYQTTQPELCLLCPGYFDGDGVGTIIIPINYCPHCGRKLGKSIWGE